MILDVIHQLFMFFRIWFISRKISRISRKFFQKYVQEEKIYKINENGRNMFTREKVEQILQFYPKDILI